MQSLGCLALHRGHQKQPSSKEPAHGCRSLSLSEWIQPEHREVHEFLLHWGRWCVATRHPGHCGSIEHRFRWKHHDDTPTGWGEWLTTVPSVGPSLPTEEGKALLIERQMRIIQSLPRKLLKFKYVYRVDPLWISRRLKFRLEDFPQKLYTARQIILSLTRHELYPQNHGKFNNLRLSDSVEIKAPAGAFSFVKGGAWGN